MTQNKVKLAALENTINFNDNNDVGTTFKKNNQSPIHRWYSYVEGFSWNFVRKVLENSQKSKTFTVLDPFCGSGTTNVEAARLGIRSVGYDINPFLIFVNSVKTNFDVNLENIESELENIKKKTKQFVPDSSLLNESKLSPLFANNDFFSEKILPKVLFLKKCLNDVENPQIKNLLMLSACSIIVGISNYRRGPDLAKKKVKLTDVPVFQIFFDKSQEFITDLNGVKNTNLKKPRLFTDDSRYLDKISDETIDCVITSPPYLNGTNYFRNTKLELWFMEMLHNTAQLHTYREKAITAGINDVFKSKDIGPTISHSAEVVEKIKKSAYDMRIPIMISVYFKDISLCLQNLYRVMKPNSTCYWVVGDSAFSQIRVPTDDITVKISKDIGFTHKRTDIVRTRKSRSGMSLHEAVIILQKD